MIEIPNEGIEFFERRDLRPRGLGMAAAAPFESDGGDIDFFAPDGNPPAPIFGIGVLRDRTPGIDALDIGEEVDVFFSPFRGDFEIFLNLRGKQIIRNAMSGDAEMAENIGGDFEIIDLLFVHLQIDFVD